MRLVITSPLAVVLDTGDVASLRAEDESGAFGVLEHHADFLTVLSVSVLTWRDGQGAEHHAAVRGGVMTVSDGETIEIATREAVVSDDLEVLEAEVIKRFRQELGAEKASRTAAARLQLAVIRHICRYLRPDLAGSPGILRHLGPAEDEPA